MRLYHFTSSHHWPAIQTTGILTVTESNISERRSHAGPDVVWLTDDPRPESHRWGPATKTTLTAREIFRVYGPTSRTTSMLLRELRAGTVQVTFPNKTEIRITVEVPDIDAHPWSRWSREQGIRNMWYRRLAEAGGDPNRWWVVTRPIPRSEWIEAVETASMAEVA
jgi:hypothetical protein